MSLFDIFSIYSNKPTTVKITSNDVLGFKMGFGLDKSNLYPTITFLSDGIVTEKDGTGTNLWITDEMIFQPKTVIPREKEADEKLPETRQDTVYGDLKLLAKSVTRDIEHHKDTVFSKIKLRADSIKVRGDFEVNPDNKITAFYKHDHDMIFNKVEPTTSEIKSYQDFSKERNRIVKLKVITFICGIIFLYILMRFVGPNL